MVISAWCIGFVKNGLPSPLFDVFEAVAPLTSTGAGLLSGLRAGAVAGAGPERGAAYFAALLLLVLALLILAGAAAAQRFLQRRFAP